MRIERRLKPQAVIDLTPLIDVVFQMVAFFMIASTFNTAPGIPLDLPKSSTSESVSVTEIRISAVSEDEIYVNQTRTSLEGLDAVLKKDLEGKLKSDLRVVLEGDKNTSYQLMISVLDTVRKNGLSGVNLLSRPDARL